MKQKILYQIGLIDDPWIEKDDKVLDKCYSEDSQDETDFKEFRRSVSMDKYTIPRIYKMEPYMKAKPKPKPAASAAKKTAGAIAVTSKDYVPPAYIRPQLKLDMDALKEVLNKR